MKHFLFPIIDFNEGKISTEAQQNLMTSISDELLSTGRGNIGEIVEWLRENTDFMTSPASTRYHFSFEGGLIAHTYLTYMSMKTLFNGVYKKLMQKSGYDEQSLLDLEESIPIVSLLHDICKVNMYHKTSNPRYPYEVIKPIRMGHGSLSVFYANQFITLKPLEAEAIYWHMGPYDISDYHNVNDLSNTFHDNPLAFILNQADMTSTYMMENRNFVQFDY